MDQGAETAPAFPPKKFETRNPLVPRRRASFRCDLRQVSRNGVVTRAKHCRVGSGNIFRGKCEMAELQSPVITRAPTSDAVYGGFWRRVIAWIIDWVIVSLAVSTMFLLLAAAIPGIASVVTLSMPFNLFTTERTVESKRSDSTEPGGAALSTTEKIVEDTVAGQWRYVYRVTETKKTGPGAARSTTTKRKQIDPVTRQDIKAAGLDKIIMIALLIYWILMEASRQQASIGKLALGMKVVDERGARLTIPRAVGRNLLKFLSVLIFFIGFLMAGWTRH